ncbi:hypothetical protein SNOG_02728 [Parastagonospora nodorum SN15]|uniref:Uncharacterized protein n=1 Tax=Phaeosphaeria nodorum (strain SN15 / ATCC MYA-4574 / FGSC 10173) TaxID=321614 RepID=Q0UZT6_PHANO|nr:hypothetical protein SNOG_02728 [Parastagonospora nodorum SN15]EAT89459.1 hypothetical protein SNOG_02728 [Parastagonospora nodorum SN15]
MSTQVNVEKMQLVKPDSRFCARSSRLKGTAVNRSAVEVIRALASRGTVVYRV